MSSHLSQILASPPSHTQGHSLISYSPLIHSNVGRSSKGRVASKGVRCFFFYFENDIFFSSLKEIHSFSSLYNESRIRIHTTGLNSVFQTDGHAGAQRDSHRLTYRRKYEKYYSREIEIGIFWYVQSISLFIVSKYTYNTIRRQRKKRESSTNIKKV